MARVVNRWDPAANVDLFVKAADGPLVLDGADERWPLFCREWVQPILYSTFLFSQVWYSQELLIQDGIDPLRGLLMRGYQYMPEHLTFFIADPVNGEPLPEDASDPYSGSSFHYLNLGYRMALRGWISGHVEGWSVDLQVDWGDAAQRNAADSRGAWSGVVATIFDGPMQRADWLMYTLHGKRLGDPSWEYRGGIVDQPASAFVPTSAVVSPWDGVDAGKVRILITGGPPAWTVQTQYWDPGIPGWVDITNTVVDLQAHAAPGMEDLLMMNGYLFRGATKVYPGAIPTPPEIQDTYARRVSVSQFAPWVADMGSNNVREFLSRLSDMGLPFSFWLGPAETKIPAIDFAHFPEGLAYAPTKVRDYDEDGGWGVLFGENTILTATALEDQKLITKLTTLGKHLPLCLCDEYAVGPTLPFAYVGRYKLKDLALWGSERCLASWGRAGYRPTPAAAYSGFGLTWRDTNGGELVLKYWDGIAPGWLELTAPLRVDEYEGKVVDIGFAWSGLYGSTIGLEAYQLRIVVNGVTLASVVEPNLRVRSTDVAFIGTGNSLERLSFVGHWFGGATFYEPCTDTDLAHAFDAEGVGGFQNPSFETAADSGQPGEAKDWEWQSLQEIGGWAEFCAYRADLAPFRGGREGFEGGWLSPYEWAYLNEAARLAATGFTADDVGKMAWQIDVNRNFVLTGYSPITWEESAAGENQGWISSLVSGIIAAAVFNEGIPNFETTQEIFALWGWPPGDSPTYVGPPWMDVYNLIPPCQDTLGPYGGPTGFDGWYDHLFGTNVDPLCTESFEEAWGNDPFSTAGGQRWCPDAAPNGVLRGGALTFPLFIPPNENQLIIITDAAIPAKFSLPTTSYADLATLVADLNALVAAHLPGLGLEFNSWSRAGEEGLTFGWDGASVVALSFMFAALESDQFRDMREKVGLRALSPRGNFTGVGIPAWWFPALPAGVATTDRFLVDTWSFSTFLIDSDPVLGTVVLENDMIGAIFDSAVPNPTLLERFTLQGWVDPAAAWISDLSAVPLAVALFDSGTHDREDFLDTEWPDEMFPT